MNYYNKILEALSGASRAYRKWKRRNTYFLNINKLVKPEEKKRNEKFLDILGSMTSRSRELIPKSKRAERRRVKLLSKTYRSKISRDSHLAKVAAKIIRRKLKNIK